MKEDEIWVFLSHSYKDYEKVIRVRNLLEKNSFRPLMFFLKCLNDDDEIDELIKREIDSRARFIFCDSENAQNSKWVQREVEYIKSKQRVYQTIDIDDTDENIARAILNFKKESTAYISYSQKDLSIFKQFVDILKKDWDFIVNEYALYMSYKSEDGAILNQIASQLSSSDWRIDVRELKHIKQKIDRALEDGYVFFIITQHFMESQSCIEELKYAYGRKRSF